VKIKQMEDLINNNPEKPDKKEEKVGFFNEGYDWLEIFAFSVATVFILFTFVLRIATVVGPSMEDTLHEEEVLVISKLFYTPKTGDIVVFQLPTENKRLTGPIVKRVIATAGQVVDIDFYEWKVYVDGAELDDSYVKRVTPSIMSLSDYEFPMTVPAGKIFVMGDNRNNSTDSRSSEIGPVDLRYLLGQVKLRLTPFEKFGPVK